MSVSYAFFLSYYFSTHNDTERIKKNIRIFCFVLFFWIVQFYFFGSSYFLFCCAERTEKQRSRFEFRFIIESARKFIDRLIVNCLNPRYLQRASLVFVRF
jgi:hypothetical protein